MSARPVPGRRGNFCLAQGRRGSHSYFSLPEIRRSHRRTTHVRAPLSHRAGDRAADGAGRARRPAARRPLQLTVIVVCIQGWMPHSNRYVPAGRWSVSVDPGAMNDATVAGGNGMMNSGVGGAPGPNTRLFRKGVNPGPKGGTTLKVCSSPPVLVTVSGVPASIVACAGAKRHPPACWLAVSWLTKSPKVTSPSPTHGTGNVAGSHLSLTRIVRPEGGADSAP